MIHEKIFDDAFILHDDLKYREHLVNTSKFVQISKYKQKKPIADSKGDYFIFF